jgi:hypothetical protein
VTYTDRLSSNKDLFRSDDLTTWDRERAPARFASAQGSRGNSMREKSRSRRARRPPLAVFSQRRMRPAERGHTHRQRLLFTSKTANRLASVAGDVLAVSRPDRKYTRSRLAAGRIDPLQGAVRRRCYN